MVTGSLVTPGRSRSAPTARASTRPVAAGGAGAVVRLTRNTTTGAISQPAGTAGCISDDGTGPCADGHALVSLHNVAVSPDNKSVYVGATGNNAVARLTRNPTTGAISQPAGTAGCISETGAGPCANGHGLIGTTAVTVDPLGKTVYATGSGAVARLDRNTTTGAITQPVGAAGCISFDGSGPCADGHGISDMESVVVSPNGKSVYATATGTDGVVRLNRTP